MRKCNQQSIRKVAGGLLVIMTAITTTMVFSSGDNAQVSSGDKYSITSSVVANGGGVSTGDGKRIEGTIGQAAAGGPYSAGALSHEAGFWFAVKAGDATPGPTPTPSPT